MRYQAIYSRSPTDLKQNKIKIVTWLHHSKTAETKDKENTLSAAIF